MAALSTEQRELQLVAAVEFKILAVANKENKLHDLLQRYLAPLILKAASDHASVRTKVIQVLARLKTFIQPPEIVLPVKALLQQYRSIDSGVVKQLDLSFIQHSLDRMNVEDRRHLVPIALQGCALDEGQPGAGAIFNVILQLLLDIQIPPRGSNDDETFRDFIGLSDDADAQYLAKLIGIFFRLRARTGNGTLAESNPTLSEPELSLFSADSPDTSRIFKRLSEVRAKLVALLASSAFTDEEKLIPAVYAASGSDTRVASTADDIIKRSSVSMENEAIVQRLFQAHGVVPAAYRTRILGMLSKSAVSRTMAKSVMAVVALDLVPRLSDSMQPSSALERTKLHKALFQYLSWVARAGPSELEPAIGLSLIQNIQAYLDWQDSTVSGPLTSQEDVHLRCRAYETIGLLARNADLTMAVRVKLATWLFHSLSSDPTNAVVVSIDGALSSLAATVPPNVGASNASLKHTLLTHMQLPVGSPNRNTRHAVVQWANQCLPFSDIQARWIDIMAIAGRENERSDVIEHGHKGLDPWTYLAQSETGFCLPDWKELTLAFLSSQMDPYPILADEQQPGHANDSSSANKPGADIFQNFRGGRIMAFPVALRYCQRMMMLAALRGFNIQPGWMQTLEALVKTDINSRDRIREYLRTVDGAILVLYLGSCLEGALKGDSRITEECMRCFVEVASLSPEGPVGQVARTNPDLLKLVKSNKKEIRELAAKAVGILVAHPAHPANDEDHVDSWARTLHSLFANAEKLIGPDANAAEGALLALGYLESRSVFYGTRRIGLAYPLHLLVANKGSSSLLASALEAFSQLWSAKLALSDLTGDYSVSRVICHLSAEAGKGNEKAITALGSLAIGLDDSGCSQAILGSILEALSCLHEIKQVEVQFAVGDAMTAAIAGWDSNSVKLRMDVEPRNSWFVTGARGAFVDSVLDRLLQGSKATKPSLLKASGIWLFCVVQYCAHLPQVQSRLREIQAAFMRLLSARDELVQETASRGISLVYERGDPDIKAALVKDLVSAFTGSVTLLKVDEETELFEPGALPTGEGSSVTSYKDIVNLANEVGDQRLIYKFMSLAANSATWSTRSAFGRFGLSNILSDAEIDPKLYRKLYRYRFDPNPNVQRSMNDIWKALVKEPNTTLEAHFDSIMEDLLKSILGREWRVREASCAAISDLIYGRPFPRYEQYYRDIWTAALKVLDDVKGSVREAALRLCMALSNGLVRQLEEGNHAPAAKAMMREAVPFLLSDKGVESSVKDVQIFATITLLKVAKHGGKALRPFVPEMVPQLLGLLSTIEPQQINYYYQRAGEESRDEIDRLRSQIVNQSPVSEAIEDCLRFVDGEVMAELAPRLEATIKSALGVPTKIGCSRVLTTLATRHASDMGSVSAHFLQLLEKQALDKNDEVSQAYARAAAYVVRAAPEASRERFCERSMDLYLQSEGESRRQKMADMIVSLAKISPDHFNALETALLPFCYLGSHDCDEYTRKVFQEVWSQHAGSSRTVVRYVTEIVALVERCLASAQWALRHTGALAAAAMASDVASATEATGGISEANLKAIWPVLDKSLALKTFAGKERLLESYPRFVEQSRSLWKEDSQVATQMKKIAVREAKRNNDEYRVHAFRCLWRFARARDDLDMLGEIAEITTPYLEELEGESKMDVDATEGKQDLAVQTAKSGLEAVARGYAQSRTKDFRAIVRDIVRILEPFLSSAKFMDIKRGVWYDCVCDLMADAAKMTAAADVMPSPFDGSGILAAYLDSLDLSRAEAGTEAQRLARAKAVSATLRAKVGGVFGKSRVASGLEDTVCSALRDERAQDVQRMWKRVVEELNEARRQD